MLNELEALNEIVQRETQARKRAEDLLAIRTQELEGISCNGQSGSALLARILNVTPDMIISCFEDFRIQSGNAAAERNLRVKASKLVDRSIDDFLPGLSAELKHKEEGPFFIDNRRACRHNGASFPVEIHGHIGSISDSVRYLFVVRDLSKNQHIDTQRHMAEIHI